MIVFGRAPSSRKLNADRLVILRLGLGRDSMTMLALLGERRLVAEGRTIGPEEVDAVVFTDPGHEWPFTYALIPRVQAFCDRHHLRFLVQKKPPAEGPGGWMAWMRHQVAEREAAERQDRPVRHGTPPWRIRRLPTIEARAASGFYHARIPLLEDYEAKQIWITRDDPSCTIVHKIDPNREMLVDLYEERFGMLPPVRGTLKRTPTSKGAEAWAHSGRPPHLMLVGFAADEEKRVKDIKAAQGLEGFETEAYPLMEMGIRKDDEQEVLDSTVGVNAQGRFVRGGFSDVKKSGCRFCKYQDIAQFWMLRTLDPKEFKTVVDMEATVVRRKGAWQAIFTQSVVAETHRNGVVTSNPTVALWRRAGHRVDLKPDKDGRPYAHLFIPLAERVDRWLSEYKASHHGRLPDVEEVARKEYRGCPVGGVG